MDEREDPQHEQRNLLALLLLAMLVLGALLGFVAGTETACAAPAPAAVCRTMTQGCVLADARIALPARLIEVPPPLPHRPDRVRG